MGNAPISQLTANPEHENTAVFLQDRWAVSNRLALNFGVRWDRQQIVDAAGTNADRPQERLRAAPRLRLGSQGRPSPKVFGSYGRYYEQIPMDLVIRSFSFERQPRIVNFDPVVDARPNLTRRRTSAPTPRSSAASPSPPTPNLKNQYINEFIVGYEREIAARRGHRGQGHLPQLRAA